MLRNRLAAAAFLAALALPLGACGGGSGGSPDGGFQREDPTLNEEGDLDTGNSGQSNQTTDNGSGTGAGRGDG
ncbi:MAG TPA: hypothetical protein VM345_18390 [Acidimicrobiales bacterium]|jgi:hypothetical protein|nr:hypothetical protein [Acidimicrobiales bacterium]